MVPSERWLIGGPPKKLVIGYVKRSIGTNRITDYELKITEEDLGRVENFPEKEFQQFPGHNYV